ncbi:MAG: protein phosphatase 2C domain-containing protein [Anaerolineae bacterium]
MLHRRQPSPTATPVCPACGQPAPSNADRCPFCGAELSPASAQPAPAKDRFATRQLAPPSPLPVGYILAGRFRITEIESHADDAIAYCAEDPLACARCGHVHDERVPYCQRCGAELAEPALVRIVEGANALSEESDLQLTFRGRQYLVTYLRQDQAAATAKPATTTLRWGHCTDVGRQRPHNEDAVACQVHLASGRPPLALFQVADGLGGQDAGEVASHMAIETAWDVLRDLAWLPHLRGEALSPDQLEDALRQAVEAANRAVFQARTRDANTMSTTLTAALLLGADVVIANVGDSRAYILDGAGLHRVTRDHSLVQRLIDDGRVSAEAAYTHPQRHLIYRSIGDQPEVQADLYRLTLSPGDRLILCSDGLWEMARDDGLEEGLLAEPDPQRASDRLCRLANLAGGEDNISIIVAELVSASAPKEE